MKVLIHAINGIGLGHLYRCITLAKEIKKQRPNSKIRFITNSRMPSIIEKNFFEYTRLLRSYKDVLDKKISISDYEKQNVKGIKYEIDLFQPDAVIYDTYFQEDAVRYAKERGAFNILILEEPNSINLKSLFQNNLVECFKYIIIPQTRQEFYKNGISKSVVKHVISNRKFLFPGPILRKIDSNVFYQKNLREKYDLKDDEFLVLATFGGGGLIKETGKFIQTLVNLYRPLKKDIENLKLIIVTGPFFSKKIGNIGGACLITKFEPKLLELMALSDLVISQASNIAIDEARMLNKPGVFVTIKAYSVPKEERGYLFKGREIGFVFDKVDRDELYESILHFNKEKTRPKIDQKLGTESAAKIICGLFEQKRITYQDEILDPPDTFSVLSYHSFDKKDDEFSVSSENFSQQMEFLKKSGYLPMSLSHFLDALNSRKKLPAGTVIITVDDADESFYKKAFPILKKHGFPAILFVCPNFINTNGFLSWVQLKELNQDNVSVQSHGMNHFNLLERFYNESKTEFNKRVKSEIIESKRIIEEKLDSVTAFAYPFGEGNNFTDRMLFNSGYEVVFNSIPGKNIKGKKLKRFTINGTTGLDEFKEILGDFFYLFTGNSCNNNCKHCSSLERKAKYDRTTEQIKQELMEMKKNKSNVIFCGGEPLLRRDIFLLLKYAQAIGYKTISIRTNGRILSYASFCDKLIKAGANHFIIYFFSNDERIHDIETKVNGSYKEAQKGINNLKKLKQNFLIEKIFSNEGRHK